MGYHQRDQSELREVFWRQSGDHVLGPGIPPRPTSVDTGFPCALGLKAVCAQLRFPRFRALPLPPGDATQVPPDPCVKFLDRPSALGQAEVIIHPLSTGLSVSMSWDSDLPRP